MKCSFCGNEMEKGFIKSSHNIFWGKDKELSTFHDDLKLTKISLDAFLNGNFLESYYCANCQKIITSLEENQSSV